MPYLMIKVLMIRFEQLGPEKYLPVANKQKEFVKYIIFFYFSKNT